jgi:hypothetical protein
MTGKQLKKKNPEKELVGEKNYNKLLKLCNNKENMVKWLIRDSKKLIDSLIEKKLPYLNLIVNLINCYGIPWVHPSKIAPDTRLCIFSGPYRVQTLGNRYRAAMWGTRKERIFHLRKLPTYLLGYG